MKVLVWNTAYLGDLVLTSSLLLNLRDKYKVSLVGRPFVRELFKDFKGVEVITYNKSFREIPTLLKRIKNFDVVLSPHRSTRTALILFFSGIKIRVGYDSSELPFLYNHRIKYRRGKGIHEIDRLLEFAKFLGVKNLRRETLLELEEGFYLKTLKKFSLKEKNYLVVSPLSNFPLKMWSLKNWQGLINLLSKSFEVVAVGKDSINLELRNCKNLINRTTLRELMAIVKGSSLVISNDSSPVHIANAFKVPALTLYTSTSPLYGFYPLIGDYLESKVPCSPCSPNPKRCKVKTKVCREFPRVEEVVERVEKLLS